MSAKEPVRTNPNDPYGSCPDCGHHLSAFSGGCTAIKSVEPFEYCDHDCLDKMAKARAAIAESFKVNNE